jgi:hypothetical protein
MRPIKTFSALALLALALLWWSSSGTRPTDVAPAAPENEAARPTVEQLTATLARVGVDASREEQVPSPPEVTSVEEEYTEERGFMNFEDLAWIGAMPGRLPVLVRSGTAPVAGARVLLFDGDGVGRTWPEPTAPGVQETRTDASGVASFGVPSGNYLVRAIDGERSVDSGPVAFRADSGAYPVVLTFGRGAIFGAAYDDAGAPRIGIEVHVYGLGPEPGRHYRRRTDGAGRFHVGHLVAGTYGVSLRGAGTRSSDDERKLRLGIGDSAEVRFGWREPGVTWSGQLVTADGFPIPGMRPLRFVELDRRDALRTHTAVDGTFERVLSAGRWALYEGDENLSDPDDQPRLAPANGAAIPRPHEAPLAVVDVAANTTFPPVVVPGSVLRARLRLEESSTRAAPPALPELRSSTALAPEPEDLGDGLVLQWTRLAAGQWTLSCRQPLLELDGRPAVDGVAFEVPSATTVERDVRYRWLR